MDKEKLALCDHLWELTQKGYLKWIYTGKIFKAKIDGTILTLWQEEYWAPYGETARFTIYLKVRKENKLFTIAKGWMGWKRIFQTHPVVNIFNFCLEEERASENSLVADLSSELTQH